MFTPEHSLLRRSTPLRSPGPPPDPARHPTRPATRPGPPPTGHPTRPAIPPSLPPHPASDPTHVAHSARATTASRSLGRADAVLVGLRSLYVWCEGHLIMYIPHPKYYVPHPKYYVPHPKYYVLHPKYYVPHPNYYVPHLKYYVPHPKYYVPVILLRWIPDRLVLCPQA